MMPAGKRILVVAYDFPPHAAVGTQRTLRLVRHLAEEQWDVRVLTGDPVTFRRDTPVDPQLLSRVPSSVGVWRAAAWRPVERTQQWLGALRGDRTGRPPLASERRPTPSSPSAPAPDVRHPQLARRLLSFIDGITAIPDAEAGWIAPAVLNGRAAVRSWEPDVIYSSAPPWSGHMVASILARSLGKPWVADFRDPWARAPWRRARTGRLGNAAAERLERYVVNAADAVIFTTTAAHDEFTSRYGVGQARRFVVVPNGCDPLLFQGVAVRPRRDMFVLLHAGSLYGQRDPEPVFHAIARLIAAGRINRGQFRLRLLGAGASSDLERRIAMCGLQDVVELAPRTTHSESLSEIASASALLLLQQGTGMSIPAKLYEYLASGRPILALSSSRELQELLTTSGTGLCVSDANGSDVDASLAALVLGTAAVRPALPLLYDGRLRSAEALSVIRGVIEGNVSQLPQSTAARFAEHEGL